MARIFSIKLWQSHFDNLVSKKVKVQVMNIIQLKLEIHDTYRKDGKTQQLLNLMILNML